LVPEIERGLDKDIYEVEQRRPGISDNEKKYLGNYKEGSYHTRISSISVRLLSQAKCLPWR
jgi:hypothetical protein